MIRSLTPQKAGLQLRRAHTTQVTGVVLVLSGGRANSRAAGRRRHLAYQRMRPFAMAVHRATAYHGVSVYQLRYRLRGWNGADRDPIRDAHWALARIAAEHPSVPVVLIGHSMGGRTSLTIAGEPQVVGVCALAPWIETSDPVDQLAGRLVVIAHGDRDQMTDPATSRRYAVAAARIGARVAYFAVIGDAHAMLRRAKDWHALARDTVLQALGIAGAEGQLARVLAGPAGQRIGVPLAEAGSVAPPASMSTSTGPSIGSSVPTN